jgi:hypothetical protein
LSQLTRNRLWGLHQFTRGGSGALVSV